ncbi:MAG: carbon monoxide dehydrogenase subunit [Alphaproteobacteria bacterium]|nr:carbon monoxide dehydrogenase subunit [Alphaproteobacteria bacterium]
MNFKYSFRLPVPADQAWTTLLDLRRVAPCMPGAAIESGEGDDYVGRVKVKIGPIEMTYRGDLRFIQRDDETRRLKVQGTGREIRGGGEAKVVSAMHVRPVDTTCEVSIDSEYTLSGKAAQFGTGMIDEIGAKLMKEFVTRLERLLLDDGQPGAAGLDPGANATRSTTGRTPIFATSKPAPADGPALGALRTPRLDDNEALDLVGLAWGPVVSRAIPIINLVLSIWIIIWLMVFDR